ncbi:metal ABC transporter ATP-binding protein [Leptolyngbya sp. PCC 6406]|uniref:metal ABC transporter ATP-binding protein n=1 Tax=Leptolyngbya sp. PCC 6406 TaxID=1173264 RepID=UPI0002ACCFC0|nr:metal ABC transporter ATP-binding protein [Leptolyngbya sp. PCC 6406]
MTQSPFFPPVLQLVSSGRDGQEPAQRVHGQGLAPLGHGIFSVQIQGLEVQYRGMQALEGITLTLQPGRLTGLIGPNGAGKSTLIKALLGLVPPTAGTARWGDRSVLDQRDRIAYVPQRNQIDWRYPATVWDVVMMGRVSKTGWLRRFSSVSRRVALAALERVAIADLRDRPLGDLSGGQQQRVFLARSLAQEADFFCFDEPFTGVDQKTESILFQVFQDLAAAGKLVLVVNHDLGEAITHFDDLILLNRSLVAAGSRQQVLTPTHLHHAYGGQVNFHAA